MIGLWLEKVSGDNLYDNLPGHSLELGVAHCVRKSVL